MIPAWLLAYWWLVIVVVLSGGWLLGAWHWLWRLHPAEEIVRFSLGVWAITLLAVLLARHFHQGLAGLLAGCLLAVSCRRCRRGWLFGELWEKLVFLLLGLSISGMGLWLLAFFSWPLALVWGWLLLVAISNFYWRRYRSFLWYSSGKVGFLPLINLFCFALGGGAIALYGRHWLWAGFALAAALSAMAGIYLLSGRKVGKLGL